MISLNDIMSTNASDSVKNRVDQAIFILFAQSIKSYKSALILLMHGYFTNATMVLRNILEITFNIKYIVEDETNSFKRADNYLTAKNNWSGETAKLKAFKVLDRYLYNVYGVICNYVHGNFMGTAQNLNENKQISIYPSTEKIKDSLNTLNAMYVYLIEFICHYYRLEEEKVNSFQQVSDIAGFIEGFNKEKDILNTFAEIIKGDDFPENFNEEFINSYKKFVVDKLKSKSKKSRRKK